MHETYILDTCALNRALGTSICVEIKRFENHGKKTYLTVTQLDFWAINL